MPRPGSIVVVLLVLLPGAAACSFHSGGESPRDAGADPVDSAPPAPDAAPPPLLPPGDTHLFYGSEAAVVNLRWSESDEAWFGTGITASSIRAVRWLSSDVNAAGDEVVAVVSAADAMTRVHLIQRSATLQTFFHFLAGTLEGQEHAARRLADVAVQDSGAALTVYAADAPALKVRTRAAGADFWSQPEELGIALDAGPARWVELAARRGDESIGLAFADADGGLGIGVWDGSDWLDLALDAGRLAPDAPARGFDLAWEEQSGRLLVAWGDPAAARVHSRLWDPGAGWGDPSSLEIGGLTDHLELVAEPGANRIALAVTDRQSEPPGLYAAIWTGSSFTPAVEIDGFGGGAAGGFGADLAWVTGSLVLAFASDRGGTVRWSTWEATAATIDGWTHHEPAAIPDLGTLQAIRVEATGSGDVLAVLLDHRRDLRSALLSGDAWIPYSTPLARLGFATTAPFSVARRPAEAERR